MTKDKMKKLSELMKASGYEGEKVADFSQCKTCGGQCCKQNACAYLPSDLRDGVNKDQINRMIDKGVMMICGVLGSNSSGYVVHLYLSAPEKNAKNGVAVGIMRSSCALLNVSGCILSKEERPSQGLALIPCASGCKNYVDFKKDIVDEWGKYKDVLEEIVKERTGKTSKELMHSQLYDEVMPSYQRDKQISLPMYLKEKLQLSYLLINAPENLATISLVREPPKSISPWEAFALDVLFEHCFYYNHYGPNIEETLEWMRSEVDVDEI